MHDTEHVSRSSDIERIPASAESPPERARGFTHRQILTILPA